MNELEKLFVKKQAVLCVRETTTKITQYNCFGDKISEDITETSSFYTLKEEEDGRFNWVKGRCEGNDIHATDETGKENL